MDNTVLSVRQNYIFTQEKKNNENSVLTNKIASFSLQYMMRSYMIFEHATKQHVFKTDP